MTNTPDLVYTGDNTTINSWVKGAMTAANPTGLVSVTTGNFGVITDTAGVYNPR
jgi:hypothetical protein